MLRSTFLAAGVISSLASEATWLELCQDNPDFTDADLPGGYGDGCDYWDGYGSPGNEVLGPTFMYMQNFTTGEQSMPAAQLFGGGLKSDTAYLAVAGGYYAGYYDGQENYYAAEWYAGMKENCPVAMEQCPTPWYRDEVASTLFDDATLLPGYGFARTVNEGYVTEAREDPLCSQDMVDAGYCAIELDNTYKPKAIALCVTPETGVQDCHDACVADQTCGAFSVTVNQGYDGGEEFGCLENKNSYCLMYPRVDYDGNVLAWDKANGGDVNYVNFRSFALDAREVTCMDCRTSDVRRSRKMMRKKRKLLFASMKMDEMECCEGTDSDPPTAGR